MDHTVTVALVGSWLPEWEPPVGLQGFDVPYSERMKLQLTVADEETLDSVLRRAVEIAQPRAVPGSPGFTEDPMSVVYWMWFYEAADENGLREKYYEVDTDLILIDVDGHARWNVTRDRIRFSDLDRSGRMGLLRGDPLRPYLVLLLPQGSFNIQLAWEATRLTWEVLGGLLATRQALKLGAAQLAALRRRLRGASVVAAHHDAWASRGGGPGELRRLIERKPWDVEDLRMVMGLETSEEARAVLEIFGCAADPTGRYGLSADLEARILRLAEEEALNRGGEGAPSPGELRERVQWLIDAETAAAVDRFDSSEPDGPTEG
jgi:hypothetical protein